MIGKTLTSSQLLLVLVTINLLLVLIRPTVLSASVDVGKSKSKIRHQNVGDGDDDDYEDSNDMNEALFPKCSQPPKQPRNRHRIVARDVTRGSGIQPSEFPWMVALHMPTVFPLSYGLGAIINNEWVLTAGHNYVPKLMHNLSLVVKVGQHKRHDDRAEVSSHKVVMVVLHEHFNYTSHENDIAAMKVSPPFKMSYAVWPICLPHFNYEFPSGINCSVVGWPINSENVIDKQVTYHQIKIPLVSSQKCQQSYRPKDIITKSMLCAGQIDQFGPDTCQGDSGSALMCQVNNNPRKVAAGIVSWGRGCPNSTKPGVYTKISHYVNWIFDAVKTQPNECQKPKCHIQTN